MSEGRVFTQEHDDADDPTYVWGTRHAQCVSRTDVFYCTVPDEPPEEPPDDWECWGCYGWLDEPPLTVEQTAERRLP